MAKALADFHHTGLYLSLHLLFEKRLGIELYRPVGSDWFTEGFFRIAEPYQNNWQTVNQFLSIHQKGIPKHMRLNKVDVVENGVYQMGYARGVELQRFKKMDFDYIIGSIPDHYKEFTRLRNMHQPKAKVICQVGNQFDFAWKDVKNLMSSTKYADVPTNINSVFYHQEFPTSIFTFRPVKFTKTISSFLHLFHRYPDYAIWKKLEQRLTDYTFKEYGSMGKENYLVSDRELAKAMHDSDFIVHFKGAGDGFGHIIHNIFACGRVGIIIPDYYKGTFAEELMIDGQTCIFWEKDKDFEYNVRKIEMIGQGDIERMSVNAHNRFNEVVDYNKEELAIKDFLDRCQ